MKLLVLLISFFIAFSATAQGPDAITWKPDRKLTWNDYKGDARPESGAAASTATLIAIGYSIGPTDFTYKISSTFSPAKSWVLHRTDHILAHEQGHFDIAEIYARKLHQRMKEYKFDRRNYERDLKKIYDDIQQEKEEMQNDYDRETDHSINKEKQAAWLKTIDRLLMETIGFSDY
jgi:uncharacterized protein DUF922